MSNEGIQISPVNSPFHIPKLKNGNCYWQQSKDYGTDEISTRLQLTTGLTGFTRLLCGRNINHLIAAEYNHRPMTWMVLPLQVSSRV